MRRVRDEENAMLIVYQWIVSDMIPLRFDMFIDSNTTWRLCNMNLLTVPL